MATGRTLDRWKRVYVDGYDFSGQARKVGPLEITRDAADLTAIADPVRGYLPNHSHVNVGAINSVFDNTATTGIHNRLVSAGVMRTVSVAQGIRAAPAQGDPVFAGQFTQGEYAVAEDGGGVVVNLPFSGWAEDAESILFASPWGVLLNANTARTAVNAAAGVDLVNVTTAGGGYMVYHVTASSNAVHTATLLVQEADTNTDLSFAALSGATTGVITVTAGVRGMVSISPTATVKQFVRWQIVLGTATSVTFVLSWHPGSYVTPP